MTVIGGMNVEERVGGLKGHYQVYGPTDCDHTSRARKGKIGGDLGLEGCL